MPSQATQLDVVTLAVALAAGVFGPELAAIVGPYAVIIIASALGAGWSASRIEVRTKWALVGHMAGMVGLALIVTVPLAEITAQELGYPLNWVMGPLAAGIGALGPDGIAFLWREGIGAVLGNLRTWLAGRLGGAPKEPPVNPPGGPDR